MIRAEPPELLRSRGRYINYHSVLQVIFADRRGGYSQCPCRQGRGYTMVV